MSREEEIESLLTRKQKADSNPEARAAFAGEYKKICDRLIELECMVLPLHELPAEIMEPAAVVYAMAVDMDKAESITVFNHCSAIWAQAIRDIMTTAGKWKEIDKKELQEVFGDGN